MVVVFLVFAGNACIAGSAYDPLAIAAGWKPETLDLTVLDAQRNREIPLHIYLPLINASAPVVLFSHGLGGSCEGNTYLGNHWSGRGYLTVFLQHPGSDTSVWKDKPLNQRMDAMKEAADGQNFMARVKDVSVVLDQLDQWNKTEKHVLFGRLDLSRVGMSGHSFGAVTTQAVSGQSFLRGRVALTDPRIKAAIMFSPSCPRRGDAKRAFGDVKIPWMLMTGTKDISQIGGADLQSRLGVFPALPEGGKYELVLFEAEHSAFSESKLGLGIRKRNPNHHKVILALSTAFWDYWLCEYNHAKTWLDGTGPDSLLEKNDRWQKK
ncbi:MAG: dienelactone hydrolase [Candidatus Riflebacteria bacterium]|nr:dienelactone hydrolase [Candidatus Riflebacteria bacterium]